MQLGSGGQGISSGSSSVKQRKRESRNGYGHKERVDSCESDGDDDSSEQTRCCVIL